MMKVTLKDRFEVLGQFWISFIKEQEYFQYKYDEFKEFFDYNNIGLPLAFCLSQGLVRELDPKGEEIINESFQSLLEIMDISVSDIEEVLPDRNIGAFLAFSMIKFKNSSKASKESEEDEDEGDTWFSLR